MSFGIPIRNGVGLGLRLSTALSSGARGLRPAMFLNFVSSNTLDSRITFTRASTATFVGSNGLIQSAAINSPRFDYDPVTLAPKGLLIEEQRVNLLLRSEEFDNASWIKFNATVTADATTSPDGTTNADKLVENTAVSAQHRVSQAVTTAIGTSYTYSAYVKAGERTSVQLRVIGATTFAATTVNLINGTLSGTIGVGVITNAGNGWYRVSITGTADSILSTCYINLVNAGNITYTGDGTSGAFIYGADIEAGAFATSYIPTVASQVTRSADVATMTGTNFSSWYNASAGTFVSQFTNSTISGTRSVLDANDSTANESIRLRTVTTNPTFTVTDGGVDQADIDAGTVAANTTYKMAGAYAANNFAASISGGAAVTDVSGTLPTVTQLQIGAAAAGNIFNGRIASISYYNTRLANDTLQALTA